MRRRDFIRCGLAAGAGVMAGAAGLAAAPWRPDPLYEISLAEWSLHHAIQNGELDHLDFPRTAREEFGIDAVEYVNLLFGDRATSRSYLRELKARAEDAGVRSLLIMCSQVGHLGAPQEKERVAAVEKHKKWVEAAAFLGCHSIRVDAIGSGSYEEQLRQAADGLRRLCVFAEDYDLNILVENHSEQSAHAEWLAAVIERADHPLVGTLPDFGNFCLDWAGAAWTSDCADAYPRYKGVRLLMPYAEAVSAKSYAFDDRGRETTIDYLRMMKIVLNAGYHGHVGIEYEGEAGTEYEGIRLTKELLERTRRQLRNKYAD